MYSPFQFAGNSPIRFVDIDGLEPGDPQNFRYNVLLLTPLPPTGPLQGLPNPVMYFADGYWILQFENSNQPGHHLYYYNTSGNNMVKFWDSYEIEQKRRAVWMESADIMAKIFVLQMEIALIGPEAMVEGIFEKAAEFVIKKAAKKYAPKAAKWMLRKADELYARAAQRLRKYKPCGCFTEGTLVLTAYGLVPIENIVVGDSVWARNDSTGEVSLKLVASTFEREFNEVYRLYFGEAQVEATYEHPIFAEGRWVTAENLRVGDTLFSTGGPDMILDSILIIEGRVAVWNLEVEDDHTYFVTERKVLVHNGKPCPVFSWQKHGTVMDDVLGKGIHGDVYPINGGKKLGEIGFELADDGKSIIPNVLGKHSKDARKQLIAAGNNAISSDGFKDQLLEKVNIAINSGRFEGTDRLLKLKKMYKFLNE
jgi:hypothetical protein